MRLLLLFFITSLVSCSSTKIHKVDHVITCIQGNTLLKTKRCLIELENGDRIWSYSPIKKHILEQDDIYLENSF